MTRPGPRGRQRAPSSSSTSNSSTMASGGIRRSGISAPGPSSDGRITKHRRLNPGVYEIGASPLYGDRQFAGGYAGREPTREVGVVEGSGLKHRDERAQQPIGDATEGAAVRVAASPVFGIGSGAVLIMLDADASPVIDRFPET